MNKPTLKSNYDKETIYRVETIIKNTLDNDHIMTYTIEEISQKQLIVLAEYANVNNIIISIKADHNNFHDGISVNLVKGDIVSRYLNYI
jgi:hypothetical protein